MELRRLTCSREKRLVEDHLRSANTREIQLLVIEWLNINTVDIGLETYGSVGLVCRSKFTVNGYWKIFRSTNPVCFAFPSKFNYLSLAIIYIIVGRKKWIAFAYLFSFKGEKEINFLFNGQVTFIRVVIFECSTFDVATEPFSHGASIRFKVLRPNANNVSRTVNYEDKRKSCASGDGSLKNMAVVRRTRRDSTRERGCRRVWARLLKISNRFETNGRARTRWPK